MRETGENAAWSWLIGLVAASLVVWSVVELVWPGATESVRIVRAPGSSELSMLGPAEEAVELYHLLPDATDDLGRVVRVDGTVVGESSSAGFWVRDLRDNVIFVAHDGARRVPHAPRVVDAGDAVRVHGVVAILTPDEQAERLGRAGLVVPASASVIQDVKILSTDDGIEVLRD